MQPLSDEYFTDINKRKQNDKSNHLGTSLFVQYFYFLLILIEHVYIGQIHPQSSDLCNRDSLFQTITASDADSQT